MEKSQPFENKGKKKNINCKYGKLHFIKCAGLIYKVSSMFHSSSRYIWLWAVKFLYYPKQKKYKGRLSLVIE